jgi:hypothetical protein
MIRAGIVLAAGLLLAGCPQHMDIRTIAGSECKVMERPPYEVRGVAVYDQRWIDRQIEGGVGACKWPRPEARPPEIDKTPVVHQARPAPKRKTLLKRIKAAVLPKSWPDKPVAPFGMQVTAPAPQPSATVEPKPCARVDELLHRCGVRRVY